VEQTRKNLLRTWLHPVSPESRPPLDARLVSWTDRVMWLDPRDADAAGRITDRQTLFRRRETAFGL
jgi:hypothetical protein